MSPVLSWKYASQKFFSDGLLSGYYKSIAVFMFLCASWTNVCFSIYSSSIRSIRIKVTELILFGYFTLKSLDAVDRFYSMTLSNLYLLLHSHSVNVWLHAILLNIPISILQIFVSAQSLCRKLIPLGDYSSKEMLPRFEAGTVYAVICQVSLWVLLCFGSSYLAWLERR